MFSHITISIKIFLMTEIIQYYTKKKKKRNRVYSSRVVLIKQKKKGIEIGLLRSFEVFALSLKK